MTTETAPDEPTSRSAGAQLRFGPHHPATTTPARAPMSRRRTTSLDMTRPEGSWGPVVVDIAGQDVVTDESGQAQVTDELRLTLTIDTMSGNITEVDGATARRPVQDLVGVGTRGGFGRTLAELFPADQASRSLLFSTLEDLGGALLVSGYDLLYNGEIGRPDDAQADQRVSLQGDICAGWAVGGPVLTTLQRDGIAALPIGPPAPTIETDDPFGWHPLPPLVDQTVRRRRRLDVIGLPNGGHAVQHHFRDSYAADVGEIVMHEYLLDANTDDERRVATVVVEPLVLPWFECPGAVASAQAVVGMTLAELPGRVRAELAGAHTCTHLNSTLRCLADTGALLTASADGPTTTDRTP